MFYGRRAYFFHNSFSVCPFPNFLVVWVMFTEYEKSVKCCSLIDILYGLIDVPYGLIDVPYLLYDLFGYSNDFIVCFWHMFWYNLVPCIFLRLKLGLSFAYDFVASLPEWTDGWGNGWESPWESKGDNYKVRNK